MFSQGRRRFVLASGGWGLASLASLPIVGRFGGARELLDSSESRCTVTRSSWALGSDVAITVIASDRNAGEAAIEAAMAELRLVEQVMSLYRPNSQVCRLNRRGSLDGPHPYLVEVLRRAAGISQASAGAFDITVQPLWKAYAASAKSGELPDDAELARITKFVDWRQVVVSRQRIEFARPSMEITLNGIAQGFAADRAMAALRRHGIQRALVDTGEIGAIGCNRSDSAWTAGIQHPRHPDAYISLIELDGRCLATSGDYATVFGDVTHNHLLDPRSGRSPREFSSVSIVAPTAMDADALSTAVFVLGTDKGLELIQSIPGVDGHFVLKDGRTIATKGFPVKAA